MPRVATVHEQFSASAGVDRPVWHVGGEAWARRNGWGLDLPWLFDFEDHVYCRFGTDALVSNCTIISQMYARVIEPDDFVGSGIRD